MNTQIFAEATDWLIKHREAELSALEKQQFDQWLRASPQHMRAYLEMSAVWEAVPDLAAEGNPSSDELIAAARDTGNVYPFKEAVESGAEVRAPVLLRKKRVPFGVMALAATLVIAVMGTAIGYWLNHNIYATAIGEQRSLVLQDGSTVDLNAHTKIRIRFNAQQRDLDLIEGQALFRVAHDTARPFIVHSGTIDVRAVGTQFDVYRKRTGTIVTVVEGKVSTGNNDNTVMISAGEQLLIAAAAPAGMARKRADNNPQPANIEAATAWTHRTLVFDSSPLTEVAEEFNRYNTRKLIITDPALASFRVSGMFSSVDPALLLSFLHAQSELRIDEAATEVRISKR